MNMPIPDGRRGFMRKLALTAAAGLGLATVGRSASARTTKDGGASPNACAVFCYVYRCNDCASGRHLFRCVNNCDHTTSYGCFTRSCAGFCLSQSAC